MRLVRILFILFEGSYREKHYLVSTVASDGLLRGEVRHAVIEDPVVGHERVEPVRVAEEPVHHVAAVRRPESKKVALVHELVRR